MNFYVYKTKFTDGRPDYHDYVIAYNESDAEDIARRSCQAYDLYGYGCDYDVGVEIICCLASDLEDIVRVSSMCAEAEKTDKNNF